MFWAWSRTIAEYLPQYAARGVVKSFFASNVPYLFPVFEFGVNEYFKVIADAVVLFRPNEWRGTSGGANPLQVY
jgi:hypothetical protein